MIKIFEAPVMRVKADSPLAQYAKEQHTTGLAMNEQNAKFVPFLGQKLGIPDLDVTAISRLGVRNTAGSFLAIKTDVLAKSTIPSLLAQFRATVNDDYKTFRASSKLGKEILASPEYKAFDEKFKAFNDVHSAIRFIMTDLFFATGQSVALDLVDGVWYYPAEGLSEENLDHDVVREMLEPVDYQVYFDAKMKTMRKD